MLHGNGSKEAVQRSRWAGEEGFLLGLFRAFTTPTPYMVCKAGLACACALAPEATTMEGGRGGNREVRWEGDDGTVVLWRGGGQEARRGLACVGFDL
jgi:hypothetical protein